MKTTKTKPSPAGGKLPAHFAMVVYDEDTRKMLDYTNIIIHHKKVNTRIVAKITGKKN